MRGADAGHRGLLGKRRASARPPRPRRNLHAGERGEQPYLRGAHGRRSGLLGDGEATPPAGTFTQVSAGFEHTCGVRTDGTLACWGDDTFGQATPPSGTFIQVSAGNSHTCALQVDGTLACWGLNGPAGGDVPAGGNVHAGERGDRLYVRGANRRHPGLLGGQRKRPGDAAIGNLHPGECGEQSCVRGANGRQPRVLGRRTGDGPGDAASGNLQPGPGQRRGRFHLPAGHGRHAGVLGARS